MLGDGDTELKIVGDDPVPGSEDETKLRLAVIAGAVTAAPSDVPVS